MQSIDLSTFDKPAEVELAKSAQKGEGDASRSAARSRGLSSISGVASGVVDAAGVLAGGVAGGVSATADAVTSAVGKLPDVTDALTLLPFRPSRRGEDAKPLTADEIETAIQKLYDQISTLFDYQDPPIGLMDDNKTKVTQVRPRQPCG